MLPPVAIKKMQTWIRSRHLICSQKILIFETFDYPTVERFEDCLKSLGGELISVDALKKVWRGSHRQVILYQVKGTFNQVNHPIQQYWYENGSLYTRFDERC
jgi:phycoerythrin-associated linker protein